MVLLPVCELIPGLALVEPCVDVDGVVLCEPVLPVCEDDVVPIWFWSGFDVWGFDVWSGFEVEVLDLS